jgi:hypothetical protein
MSVLLYCASYGSVLALFASFVGVTLWISVKLIQAWGRFFQALLNPPAGPRNRVRIDPNPHYLKRAGQ